MNKCFKPSTYGVTPNDWLEAFLCLNCDKPFSAGLLAVCFGGTLFVGKTRYDPPCNPRFL